MYHVHSRLKVEGSFYEEFKAPPDIQRHSQQSAKKVADILQTTQKTVEDFVALVQAAALSILGSSVNEAQSLVEAGLDSLGESSYASVEPSPQC